MPTSIESASITGTSATTAATTIDRTPTKNNTRGSPRLSVHRPVGKRDTRSPLAAHALTSAAHDPPIAVRIAISVAIWRMRRPRLIPIARRTAISRLRRRVRSSSRLVTLAQASSSTSADTPAMRVRISTLFAVCPARCISANVRIATEGAARTPKEPSTLASATSRASASLCAARIDAPSRRRAIMLSGAAIRISYHGMSTPSIVPRPNRPAPSGIQRSTALRSTPAKARCATPITRYVAPENVIARPIAAGSAPISRSQNAYAITTERMPASGRSSSPEKKRPMAGRTPAISR